MKPKSNEQREPKRKYARPAMVEYGAIVALTQGDS